MRILGMTAPEALVMLAVYCIPVIVLYWVIRFAVKHGVKDALKDLSKDTSKQPDKSASEPIGVNASKLLDKVDEK